MVFWVESGGTGPPLYPPLAPPLTQGKITSKDLNQNYTLVVKNFWSCFATCKREREKEWSGWESTENVYMQSFSLMSFLLNTN